MLNNDALDELASIPRKAQRSALGIHRSWPLRGWIPGLQKGVVIKNTHEDMKNVSKLFIYEAMSTNVWKTHATHITSYNQYILVGGLERFYFSIYWECHHPN